MKTHLSVRLCLALAALALSVSHAPLAAQPPAPVEVPELSAPLLTAEQLEQLLGPIALYPDALIALILPASTAPADVVLAARFLADNGDAASVSSRSWDESVKSLAHFPTVVQWMDHNLAWTKQVGEAFRDQPAEVMKAIQRLRARARDAGTLSNSTQQQLLLDGDVISIIPSQPNAIYVPYYDPAVVYYRSVNYYPRPYFSYSSAFAVGSWLTFECDWHHRTIWTADRRRNDRDWRRPIFPGQAGYVHDPNRHQWKPAPSFPRSTTSYVVSDRPRESPPHSASFTTTVATSYTSPVRRDDRRNPEPEISRATVVTNFPVAPAATPAPNVTPTPQPRRRIEPNRDQSYRVAPTPTTTTATISPTANPSNHFPYGQVPSGPLVAPLSGPLVAPMMPAAAPPSGPHPMPRQNAAPPPAPAATQPASSSPPPEERKRGDRERESERKVQPN